MKKFLEQFAKPSGVLGSLADIQMQYRHFKPVSAVCLIGCTKSV